MSDKTIVDAIDNTVNQLSNGVQVLGNGVQALGNAIAKVAPDAWKILVHQQKVLGLQDIINGILILIGVIIFGLVYKKFVYNKFSSLIETDYNYGVGQIVSAILFTIFATIGLFNSASKISDGFVRYNSAEYYAAKDALNMVK